MNIQPATIATRNWRGTYVARVSATGGRIEREWVEYTREKLQTGYRRLYRLGDEPGYFEVREGHRYYKGEPNPPRYYRYDGRRVALVEGSWSIEALEGPPPGSDGEWFGERCECGAEVLAYTPAGFPFCAEHEPKGEPVRDDAGEVFKP